MNNQTFYIAVCDDVKEDQKEIAEMTEEICKAEQICPEITCYSSAKELFAGLEEGKKYDMMLIDVLMPGQDGIELARILRSHKEEASIVFISCNREMALQGYEVSAARYLAKPLDKDKLKEAILFCYGQHQKEEMLFKVDGSMRKIRTKDIYYIEIVARKCRLRFENEEMDVNISLTELEEKLSGHDFIRCHKSFLVNCRHIRSILTSSVELTDGRRVPVSKHRIKEVKQAFVNYMND